MKMLIGPRLTWVEMNALSFDFCSPRPLIALTSRMALRLAEALF